VGFYVDDITISDAEEMVNPIVTDTIDPSFVFTPPETVDYSLRVRAKVEDRLLEWGEPLVARSRGPLRIKARPPVRLSTQLVQLDFDLLELVNASSGDFQIEVATSPAGPWRVVGATTIFPLPYGGRYRAYVAPGGAPTNWFFRIAGH
jgi:hypothetical protein